MDLILDERPQHCFNKWYHEILIKSGKFTVKYEKMSEHDRMLELDKIVFPNGRKNRHGQISFAKIDGKLIVFDTQFDDNFSIKYISNGLLTNFQAAAYIKYKKNENVQKLLNCPLVVWAMFPAGWELVNKFEYNSFTSDYNVMASGMNSLIIMKRKKWFEHAKTLGIDTQIAIPSLKYLSLINKSRFGVILSIRNEKNTREYEFISNLMPLALNYQPEFDFDFIPGVHYLYMKDVNDLSKLITEDPTKYYHKSKYIWENYFRPDMAANIIINKINKISVSTKLLNSYGNLIQNKI